MEAEIWFNDDSFERHYGVNKCHESDHFLNVILENGTSYSYPLNRIEKVKVTKE